MSVASVSIGARPLSVRGSATTLLAALLVATTGWSVLAGGWTDGEPNVILVGLAGVVEGVVLARGRVHRLLALAAAPLLLFVSLLPASWSSRPPSAPGAAHVVGQYAGAALTGLLGNARWEFNIGLATLLWICGAWAAWFAVRERRGAIATGPCWSVIAVNVINAPSTDRVTLPAALAAAAAIGLIAAVHLDRLSESWRQRRVSVLPGTGGRFAGAAAVGGVVIVLLALVIPPLSATDISGRLFGNQGAGAGGHGQSGVPGGAGGAATVRFSASTIPGGALTLSNSPVLSYQSSLLTGVYLRMATDGVFAGGNWLPAQSANNNGDDTAEVVLPGVIPRDRVLADGGVAAQQQAVSLSVIMVDDTSDANTLPFAGEPQTVGVAAIVSGLTGPEAPGQLLTVDGVNAQRQPVGHTIVTSATQSTATAEQLRRAGQSYPSWAVRDFLGLTEDNTGGAAAIRALALQWTQGSATPYDKATAIENDLRNPHLFRYTLKPPAPPASQKIWPLTYFLTTSHSGYCQYFAAAMGTMLRAVGIPARLVNGYGPGTSPNAASHGTGGESSWTVSSNDAHTWVEAYFPGYGWIPFEPTPPSSAGNYQPFARGSISQATPGAGHTTGGATPKPTTIGAISPLATDGRGGRSSGGRTVLMGAGAVLAGMVLILALFVIWFLRPRDVRGVWQRVGIVGRAVGVPRDRSLTFDEYVARLTAALPPDRPGGAAGGRDGGTRWGSRMTRSLVDIAVISDRAFYAPSSVRSEETVRLKRAWHRVALLAPHLARRAPARPEAVP
jgi:hypothetical protein